VEEKIVESALRPRRQQPEIADIVDVAVRDLMAQTLDKLGHGIASLDHTSGFQVLCQKPDLLRTGLQYPMLGDGRSPHITASVPKDLPLVAHYSTIHMPPSLILIIQQLVKLLGPQLGSQKPTAISHPEEGDHRVTPHLHDSSHI
jgi:hypothetical protein